MIDVVYVRAWKELMAALDDPEVPGDDYVASLNEMIEELESRLAATEADR